MVSAIPAVIAGHSNRDSSSAENGCPAMMMTPTTAKPVS